MKNKIIKSYSLFLLIFLFSASVFATCDTELDSSFDSTKPECFDFEKGDYSTITNWEQIDQAQIPIGRIQEVPPEHLAYFQLSSEQKLEMTSDQISKNFNLIVNLASDVNPEKAKEAIKKLYGITITSLSQGANLKDGTLSATFGNLDNVPLSLVSETTEVEIDDDGNILLKGETTPPAEGSYTAVYNDFTIITTPDGNELNVYGKISFNNGQTYLREDVGATINGITIANKGYYFSDDKTGEVYEFPPKEIYLFFDGERHEGNYISMNSKKENVFFSTTDNTGYNLNFRQENPFLDSGENDYFSILLSPDSDLSIESRGNNMIPLVTLKEGDQAFTTMTNGRHKYNFDNAGSILFTGPSGNEGRGSVPFTLILHDSMGNNILGTESEREKAVFDNNGNLAIIPESLPSRKFECNKCVIDLSESSVFYNYITSQLFEKTKGIRILLETDDATALSRVLSMLNRFPPDVLSSFNGIQIVPDEEVSIHCSSPLSNGNPAACAGISTLTIGESAAYEVLYHEAAHTLTWDIASIEIAKAETDLKEYELELKRKYDLSVITVTIAQAKTSTDDQGNEISVDCVWNDLDCFYGSFFTEDYTKVELTDDEIMGYLELKKAANQRLEETGTFRSNWMHKPYRTGLSKEEGSVYALEWDDFEYGPRYGFVDPYGANNFAEDVSTYVQPIARGEFVFLHELINPNSDFYMEQTGELISDYGEEVMTPEIANEWANIYRNNINLLHQNGFIRDEDYVKIIMGEE